MTSLRGRALSKTLKDVGGMIHVTLEIQAQGTAFLKTWEEYTLMGYILL